MSNKSRGMLLALDVLANPDKYKVNRKDKLNKTMDVMVDSAKKLIEKGEAVQLLRVKITRVTVKAVK